MHSFFPATIVAASITISATIPARAQPNNPLLEELHPQLQAALQKVAPNAMWELKGNELMASYKTREFVTYPISTQGTVATQPRQEIGPANGGFILRFRIFPEIPNFALQAPLSTRQAYWKTYVARTNLRASTRNYSTGPRAILLDSEAASGLGERSEFENSPQWSYVKLLNIENYGLFQIAHAGKVSKSPITRYESSVFLMRLQEAIPDLTKDKSSRIAALQTATVTAGHKLSLTEIQSLDEDIRDLQIEFAYAIHRLEARTISVLEARPPYGTVEPKVVQKPQPAYLVLTLQTPLNNEKFSPQPFAQIIEDAARENNRRADEK